MSTVDLDTAASSTAPDDVSLYRAIFERATDGVAIIAPDGTYVEQNASHQQMLGWTTEELRGRTPAIHMGEESFRRVFESLTSTDQFRGEVESRDRHGRTRVLELSAFAVRDAAGAVVAYVGAKRDVSEQRAGQSELRRRYSQLRSIYRMTAAVGRASDLGSILREALDCLTTALGTRRASVLLLDDDGVMRFRDWRRLSEDYRRAVEGHSPWSPDDTAPKAFMVSDVASETSMGELRDIILAEGIAAAAFVPIVFQTRLLGKFMIYFDSPREMPAEELQLAEAVAGHIGFAIARRRAEEELVRREREFQALAEQLPDILARLDREYRFLYVNPVIESATGLSPETCLGRTGLELGLPPDVMTKWHALLERVFTSGRPADGEFVFETPAGRRFFHTRAQPEVVENDAVCTVLCTTRDVTRLKKAEVRQRLLAETGVALVSQFGYREALDQVARLVIENFAEGCAIDLAKPDGTLERLAVRDRFPEHTATILELEARYPTPLDSVVGHVTAFRTGEALLVEGPPDELMRQASVDDEHFAMWKRLEMSGVICAPLFARGRSIGVITFVAHRPSPPFDAEDLAFAQQLAERVALAVDNLRLYEASLAANQTKSDFMATMSHELRTPLNAIIGYAELLGMRISGQLNDPQAQQVDRIHASAAHLLTVIEEILTFSRVEAGKETVDAEVVDVLDLARSAAAMIEPAAQQKGLAFVTDLPQDGTEEFTTDAVKLRQILLNLLSNAVKFTPSGCVAFSARADEAGIEFTVQDSGIGIAAEHLDRIFDPFWQVQGGATRRTGGTGLGLTVSRQLSELLGAQLHVVSEAGQGSRFTVRLPRVQAER